MFGKTENSSKKSSWFSNFVVNALMPELPFEKAYKIAEENEALEEKDIEEHDMSNASSNSASNHVTLALRNEDATGETEQESLEPSVSQQFHTREQITNYIYFGEYLNDDEIEDYLNRPFWQRCSIL